MSVDLSSAVATLHDDLRAFVASIQVVAQGGD
jgi:hypothetical protein